MIVEIGLLCQIPRDLLPSDRPKFHFSDLQQKIDWVTLGRPKVARARERKARWEKFHQIRDGLLDRTDIHGTRNAEQHSQCANDTRPRRKPCKADTCNRSHYRWR